MASTFFVSRRPDGLVELEMQGRFFHPHWVAYLFSSLAQQRVSIVSGRAVQGASTQWEATFQLDFGASAATPESLDYARLAETRQLNAAYAGTSPLKLSSFRIERDPGGKLEVAITSTDQVGFLGQLLTKVSLLGLFPFEMEIQTTDEETRVMYPFEFAFDVIYTLEGTTLLAGFETRNTGEAPLPYYAGHHFYFAVPSIERANWRIELPCRTWGYQNADGSVRFEPAQNTATTLEDTTLIDRFQLDFAEPRVALQNLQTHKRIEIGWDSEYSDLWYDVTTWTQAPDSDFFCVEPWLGLPNAIHHGHGLRWIAPGHEETAVCKIAVD